MLIRRQNSYDPRGKQRTGGREVQNRELVNKFKKKLCIFKLKVLITFIEYVTS
jgi:hypothetical protein